MISISAKDMSNMDLYTINNGMPGIVLMENASKSVVNEIQNKFQGRFKSVLIVCGKGNNGGDGLCVARWLKHIGHDVRVLLIGDANTISKDAKIQYNIIKNSTPEIVEEISKSKFLNKHIECDILIDAIFGTGLNRELTEEYNNIIKCLNAVDAYKIAIDIPSGVIGSTGMVYTEAFVADLTITFAYLKTGLLINDAPEYVGELKVTDIGILKNAISVAKDKINIINKDFMLESLQKGLFKRKRRSHKGTYGRLGIIVSSSSMLGASILAAKSAIKTGCGLVRVLVNKVEANIFNMAVPEVIVDVYDKLDINKINEFANNCSCILTGPGLKEDKEGELIVDSLLKLQKRVVFDAGALNILSYNTEKLKYRKCELIITPHIAEMARLTSKNNKYVLDNTISLSKEWFLKYNVVTVLKSDRTVIMSENTYINIAGNAGMATAGSGDVLTGCIAALLSGINTLEESAVYGVLLHSIAADTYLKDYNMASLTASDIIKNLWKELN